MKETIKANDLRIGNLVNRYFEKKYDFGSSMEWQPIVFNLDDFKLLKCFKHKPILLTEEWLLKFGFVTSERLWDSFSRSNYYLSKKGELCFNLHESKNIFYMYEYRHIEYVHQLQNLYFALTGEELTIKEQ
jgi:hypothetical protein